MIEITKWPCNIFPCGRTILSGKSEWKINNIKKLLYYCKYHLVTEIKRAFKHYKIINNKEMK